MKVHFIAIGGSAMHNLALALNQNGDEVSGSDDAIFEPSKSRLDARGLLPETLGWDEKRITSDLDAVILGMHAKADNPELRRAKELGLTIFSYPEFLYSCSKNKTRVVIGGSHGKTTITSMILHVLGYHDRSVDFMVGAQLAGYDTMVHLTQDNEFMLLEGDEYLSSPIDRRPKFHLYAPNIALISGIAWDHINVFPTFENYCLQFSEFIEKMTPGGTLIYNEEDETVRALVEQSNHPIKKIPYRCAPHSIDQGVTYLETPEGELPIEIFGAHNLSNLEGARWICQLMGVDSEDFYEAIGSFQGASKRLERLLDKKGLVVFKDFAHAPSKVSATVSAVREQYPDHQLVACLELHTYSSLSKDFIGQYHQTLKLADRAVVFYQPETLALKNRPPIDPEVICESFDREDLNVITDTDTLHKFIHSLHERPLVVLLMSSGNYGGLDLTKLFVD
jgi:UDP-N-acetylmuramate: L-alanyl-gamma-D-glutamyl-meso-diaminopimelate ligase